ncbi:hypothetical protein GMDG_04477 [Pseudogymnoascus destructans 20631-21]|uniref:DUF7704 domain-containing protein n=1 Tax=Pseudogymnoascus destructans (strain ATCC MYA-4855 / 20631-21) TaxID=658429 RepID=L8GDA4_PSED2|nr:hypothetical protein GMDG_04477 [Pseudogymnoascus destructans 20631-21]
MPPKPTTPTSFRLPLLYTTFFLTIEPLSTLLGAYFAYFQPHHYLTLTTPSLANLYLLLSLTEATLLRTTNDLAVWRVFLFGLLVADVGHVWSVREAVGWEGYWNVARWNAMDWGNLGFVYVAAALRVAFLMGVGLPGKVGGRLGRRLGEGWGKVKK